MKAIELIRKSEAYREFAYPDPGSDLYRATRKEKWGFVPAQEILNKLDPKTKVLKATPWTCGYGETKGVTSDTQWSQSEAYGRLVKRVEEFFIGVLDLCKVPPNENQLNAFTSCVYNIGLEAFKTSSMLKNHNKGDFAAAARSFALWNKSNGRVMPGLIARRAEEAALYLTPVDESEPIPQTIDKELPMTSSTINKASIAAGTSAGLAAVSETLTVVNEVKYGVESLGNWVVPILLVAVVGMCGFIVWQRWDMRQKGIA